MQTTAPYASYFAPQPGPLAQVSPDNAQAEPEAIEPVEFGSDDDPEPEAEPIIGAEPEVEDHPDVEAVDDDGIVEDQAQPIAGPPFADAIAIGGIPAMLTIRDLAAVLQVDESTIHRWVRRGQFPEPVKFDSGTTRWPSTVVSEFISELSPRRPTR
jgi:predicted DNA-binding transcriptional regulator AlpA